MFHLVGGSVDALCYLLNFLLLWNTVAINVDFHSATIFGFVLCVAKACSFSKSPCLLASSLFFLTRYLLTLPWHFLMHAHSYFIDTPLSELVLKGITRNFVKLSSFSYYCFFALILESAPPPLMLQSFSTDPTLVSFAYSFLSWFELRPNLVCQLDLNKGTQSFCKFSAKYPVSSASLLDLLVPMT